MNTKDINDNKKFWKTVKLMFTDKIKQTQNITLIENKKNMKSIQALSKFNKMVK